MEIMNGVWICLCKDFYYYWWDREFLRVREYVRRTRFNLKYIVVSYLKDEVQFRRNIGFPFRRSFCSTLSLLFAVFFFFFFFFFKVSGNRGRSIYNFYLKQQFEVAV